MVNAGENGVLLMIKTWNRPRCPAGSPPNEAVWFRQMTAALSQLITPEVTMARHAQSRCENFILT